MSTRNSPDGDWAKSIKCGGLALPYPLQAAGSEDKPLQLESRQVDKTDPDPLRTIREIEELIAKEERGFYLKLGTGR